MSCRAASTGPHLQTDLWVEMYRFAAHLQQKRQLLSVKPSVPDLHGITPTFSQTSVPFSRIWCCKGLECEVKIPVSFIWNFLCSEFCWGWTHMFPALLWEAHVIVFIGVAKWNLMHLSLCSGLWGRDFCRELGGCVFQWALNGSEQIKKSLSSFPDYNAAFFCHHVHVSFMWVILTRWHVYLYLEERVEAADHNLVSCCACWLLLWLQALAAQLAFLCWGICCSWTANFTGRNPEVHVCFFAATLQKKKKILQPLHDPPHLQ